MNVASIRSIIDREQIQRLDRTRGKTSMNGCASRNAPKQGESYYCH